MQEEKREIQKEKISKKEAFKNLLVVLLIVFGAYGITVWIGVDRLQSLAQAAGIYGAFTLILLKITTIVFVPLGGGPIYPIAGAVYGFWPGLGLTIIGDVIGFTIAFFLSKKFGQGIVRAFIPQQQYASIDKILARGTRLKTLIKARITFAAIPEVFAYAAGLTKVPYITFIMVMMVVQIPTSALMTLFGDLLLSGDLRIFIPTAILGGVIILGSAWFLKRDLSKD